MLHCTMLVLVHCVRIELWVFIKIRPVGKTYDFLLSLSSTSMRLFDMITDENIDLAIFYEESNETHVLTATRHVQTSEIKLQSSDK